MSTFASKADDVATDSLRIGHGAANIADNAAAFRFTFEGKTVEALPGDSIAMALWAAGVRQLRSSPTAGTARGLFCAMGSCQECAVRVNGTVTTSCNTLASEGLEVTALQGLKGQSQ